MSIYAARKAMIGRGAVPISSPNHPDLIAMYTMDNVSGATLVDESANSRDGIITGATFVAGHLNNAIDFDGIDDFVALPPDMDSVISISAWMRRPAGVTPYLVNTTTSSTGDGFQNFGFNSSGNFFAESQIVPANSDAVRTTASFAADTYHHVVFQTTGSSFTIFVNGVIQAKTVITGTDSGRWFDAITSTDLASFGARIFTASIFRKSRVDQVRFFSRELLQAEVNDLNNGGVGI
jgi:hypothetical protein